MYFVLERGASFWLGKLEDQSLALVEFLADVGHGEVLVEFLVGYRLLAVYDCVYHFRDGLTGAFLAGFLVDDEFLHVLEQYVVVLYLVDCVDVVVIRGLVCGFALVEAVKLNVDAESLAEYVFGLYEFIFRPGK